MLLPHHRASHSNKVPDARSAWKTQWLYFVILFVCLVSSYELLMKHQATWDLVQPTEPGRTASSPSPPSSYTLPPTYAQYHEAELRLPQHHWSRTRPAADERFFFVAGHVRGLGWGNALQEHLLNAYLAHISGRSFVFANYTWNDDGSIVSFYNGKPIPSQIPYSALIRGPAVGGAFLTAGDDSGAPLAVHKEYFDHICPEKFEISREDVHQTVHNLHSAYEVTQRWSETIKATNHPCVQSSVASSQVYSHYYIFGARGALAELWPSLAESPIITQFGWSHLIESAFDANKQLFYPSSVLAPNLTEAPFTTNMDRYTPIPGLMAIHIRRGDYLEHCTSLTDQREEFVSVNSLPGLPDSFAAPRGFFFGELTRSDRIRYRQRCYPSVEEIVRKVEEVRATPEGENIRRIYIMTNGKQDFINDLKDALNQAGRWDLISSSRDMVLDVEQKYVAQAVDMLVAQRAQIFIGNGFSTLTSGAVMMRLANRFPTNSTRFW